MKLFHGLQARAYSIITAGLMALALLAIAPAPAQAFKLSQGAADAMLTAQKALPNSGTLVIYSGTVPADPDTALAGNTALATFTFNSTACGSISTSSTFRVCTLSFVSNTVTASNTGTATFARMYESNGTTVDADWTVGTSGTDLIFNSASFTSGGNVTLGTTRLKMPFH